jgi:hypothetical protein
MTSKPQAQKTQTPKTQTPKTQAARTETPWGKATVLEELTVAQRAGDKRFASVVQLLEGERGQRFVRFAYSTGGAARRGPVTLRAQDVGRLLKELETRPGLAEALGVGRGGGA